MRGSGRPSHSPHRKSCRHAGLGRNTRSAASSRLSRDVNSFLVGHVLSLRTGCETTGKLCSPGVVSCGKGTRYSWQAHTRPVQVQPQQRQPAVCRVMVAAWQSDVRIRRWRSVRGYTLRTPSRQGRLRRESRTTLGGGPSRTRSRASTGTWKWRRSGCPGGLARRWEAGRLTRHRRLNKGRNPRYNKTRSGS